MMQSSLKVISSRASSANTGLLKERTCKDRQKAVKEKQKNGDIKMFPSPNPLPRGEEKTSR
ncbi:MAG: hypothetical protein A2252_04070 [Elusimicrobia bacterium RIFOXYA2_FULL_39_19]|nr:MAG: hypothetical protein A2252_04070 [Elusimicrobia bacterium RIFOXYA2_FULL_39_19]